jgi:uncharacterized membrane protein (DUF2068 family)
MSEATAPRPVRPMQTKWGWHPETFVCSRRGHVTPAARVARLRSQDVELGVDLADGRRLARCLRCDVWVEFDPPEAPENETLPPLERLPVPRRGRLLREAIILRLIAIDRGVHAVIFGLLAGLLFALQLNLASLRHEAQQIITDLTSQTGQGASQGFIVRELHRFLHVEKGTVTLLAITALAYCLVEGVEAVGLWRERRWAEYLTAVATAGFLPFEVDELIKRVTVLRVGALVVNVAILVWLVWRKRLFGVRGGPRGEAGERPDPVELFGPKRPIVQTARRSAAN